MASFCLHFQNLIQRKHEFELNEEENFFDEEFQKSSSMVVYIFTFTLFKPLSLSDRYGLCK